MLRSELPDDTNCHPFSPEQIQSLLQGASFPWWITGGWALDLFLGHQTRSHFDIDIAIPRDSQTIIHAHLLNWEFWSIRRDEKDELVLQEWENDQHLEFDFPGVWAREVNSAPWRFEFLFQEIHDSIWTFRYCHAVKHPITEIAYTGQQGIPYLRPEIVLLTKAVRQRPVDVNDFRTILPLLDASQRTFMLEDIQKISPTHPWLAELGEIL